LKIRAKIEVKSSIVIDELDKETIGLAYIYFDYQDQDHQSLVNVFASILRQLSARMNYLIPEIYALHRKLHARGARPDIFSLIDCIISSSAAFSSTYIILDALDASDQKQRPRLLNVIQQLSDGPIKVFATGRPYLQDVNDFFQGSPNIMKIVITANVDDLKNYISTQVNQRKLGDEKFKDKLMDKLSK
jgi:hypothetical protein